MWIQPTVISGSSLGRSKWKMVQQSLQFILQQGPSETDANATAYRIVTRSFPTYLIAKSDVLPESLDHFRFLHEEFLERMPAKKPKELVSNLKAHFPDFPQYVEPQANEEAVTKKLNERIEKALSRVFTPEEMQRYAEDSESEEEKQVEAASETTPVPEQLAPITEQEQEHQHEQSQEQAQEYVQELEPVQENIEASIYKRQKRSLQAFKEGCKTLCSFLTLPSYVKKITAKSDEWIFPFNVHTLLLYPSAFQKDGVTHKNAYDFLKEVQAINTRRKVALAISVYSLALRFCSLDLFYFMLIFFNLVILYLIKDTPSFTIESTQSRIQSDFIYLDSDTESIMSAKAYQPEFHNDSQLFHDNQSEIPDDRSIMAPSIAESAYGAPSIAGSSFMAPSIAGSSFMAPSVMAPSIRRAPSAAGSFMGSFVAPSTMGSFVVPRSNMHHYNSPSIISRSTQAPSLYSCRPESPTKPPSMAVPSLPIINDNDAMSPRKQRTLSVMFQNQ